MMDRRNCLRRMESDSASTCGNPRQFKKPPRQLHLLLSAGGGAQPQGTLPDPWDYQPSQRKGAVRIPLSLRQVHPHSRFAGRT